MIRPYRFKGGTICVCLWILFLLCTVCECRRYDKCVTRDGRQGVCVVKRYCREASASDHALLPCDGDAENHCCPIPTTQRSAAPQPVPPRPEVYRPDDDEKARQRPVPPREPDRDDRLNKTPPPGDRRDPGHTRTSARPIYDDRRDPPSRRPDNDRLYPAKDDRTYPAKDDRTYPAKDDRTYPAKDDRTYPAKDDRTYPAKDDRTYPAKDDRTYPAKDDRIYPAKDELNTEPPRRANPSKHRNDDSSKAPIRFPEPYEFSVPSPKVPACGVKPYELFIAGGEESERHEWPWMTAIFRRHPDSRPKTFLCGGSLINTKYVLTAAHCFVNNYVILPASSFVVRVGSHFLDSGEEYTVANLVVHHNHSGSDFFNDIALVRLASEVYITDKVAPICLPDPIMIRDNLVGRMATVAGWGDTSFRTGHTRILQHVTVPIVSGEECFAAYSRVRGAAFLARGSDHVICAGLREGGKDACLGDSGGPLMMKMPDDRWIVVGIVSLGYKCAEPGYPGVYTRVTHYMSWINTNMKRH